jgi:NADPH:quinone reductase-like Zn-dependent oxidoreductase
VIRTELQWYPTRHTKDGHARSSAVVGHEFSGVVHATGLGVKEFRVNDAVYGMNDWFDDGTTAEYCVTVPGWIGMKPQSLFHEEAATVPISALTAWQGLYERAQVKGGERVLVHGGAGAVGAYAVQLAALRGARVTVTALPMQADYVKSLGAEQIIDYRSDPFQALPQGFDVVFDTIGGSTLERSWNLLGPGGRMVTIAASEEGRQDERTKQAFFIVRPHHGQLDQITALIDGGALKVKVAAIVPLRDAPSAYDADARRFGNGKVAISIKQ